jgi:hypothetical protein
MIMDTTIRTSKRMGRAGILIPMMDTVTFIRR